MIFHVFSEYVPKHPDTARRHALAKKTWETQPWTERPILEKDGRIYQDKIGRVPYVKDILEKATHSSADRDIIVFTNADTCVSSICCVTIVGALQSINAAYCFRRDFGRLDKPLDATTIKKGTHYVGSDLYAFRTGWWRKWRHEFPDMLLGRECWDAIMRLLIDQTHPNQNPTLYDLIYHERHGTGWENPANRRTVPSQMHNVRLARSWMLNFGYNPASIGA